MLTKMFTVATESDGNSDADCQLLFHKTDDMFTTEEIQKIVEDPLCRQLMGDTVLATRKYESTGESLLLSREFYKEGIKRLSTATKEDAVTVVAPEVGTKHLNLQEVYYGCKLPHRTIIGCKACANTKTKKSCVLKTLWNRTTTDDYDDFTAENATTTLKNRRSAIAEFTYISPKLTQPAPFLPTHRDYINHDFSRVADNSASIKQGIKERARIKQFVANACSQCLVHKTSRDWTENHYLKYCIGPYAKTDKEAHKQILQKIKIPYTNKQLLFLALNSGELDLRYKKRIYWATFSFDICKGFVFGLRRKTTGAFEPFNNYKEAEEVIRKCKTLVHELGDHKPLTLEQKAVLLELSRRDYSPVHRSGWHRTEYDALGIELNPWRKSWTLNFKFNSYGDKYSYRPYGLLLPWNVTASTLSDVFQHYHNLRLLSKTEHEDSRRNTFNHSYYWV